jgi:phage terminase small subunit
MSGVSGQPTGGFNKKTIREHVLTGTFRADRHAKAAVNASVVTSSRRPRPPKGLSDESARLWRKFHQEYDLSSVPTQELLTSALRARDIAEQARATLERDGLTYLDSSGKPKAHPAAAIGRDARAAYVSTLRVLGFPSEEN